MFEKAKSLVRNDGLVLEKSGATYGFYIVTWSANRSFCVSSGRRGSFKCDRSSINSRTKICEHVIAVAEKCGKLQQFVEWFRQSKYGASVSVLAMNGAPKSMRRKRYGRKRSNRKRADIEEVVNIFAENKIENSSLYSLSPNNANGQNEKSINEKHINFHISGQMHFQEFNNNILPVHSSPPLVQQQISNPFFLKWVSGTTVSHQIRRLACWIISLLLGKISFINVIEIQESYNSQASHKMFILIQIQDTSMQNTLHLIYVTSLFDTFIYPYLQPEHKFKLLTEFNINV